MQAMGHNGRFSLSKNSVLSTHEIGEVLQHKKHHFMTVLFFIVRY